MSTIILTGGTGLIGRAISKTLLAADHSVIILTRDPSRHKSAGRLSYAAWDLEAGTIDEEVIKRADAIIHLAGAGVADKRWTEKRKQEIRDSRVKSGQLICSALRSIPNNVNVVVAASAIGWYGPDLSIPNTKPFIETDEPYDDFLGTTCVAWEQSMDGITVMGRRLVILRTGIVLSMDGGALAEFAKPIKFGIASILSTGKQLISWIHLQDLVRMYVESTQQENWSGVYNAVAPAPVSNKELVLELARQLRGKTFLPIHVPGFMLKLMLGEMSIEVLKSTTVSSRKISQAGFQFAFPSIESALSALTGRVPPVG